MGKQAEVCEDRSDFTRKGYLTCVKPKGHDGVHQSKMEEFNEGGVQYSEWGNSGVYPDVPHILSCTKKG